MKPVTAHEMAELEQLAIGEYGISGLILMENAARSFCDALEKATGALNGRRITIYCGGGNNGGDGFAIGRHAANRGANVTIAAVFDPHRLKADAKTNFDIITRMGLLVLPWQEAAEHPCDIVVDALLGTGFSGELREPMPQVFHAINTAQAFVAAVDIPSGCSADDGAAAEAVHADLTVTFGLAKVGHFLYPAKEFCGQLVVTDISLPHTVVADFPSRVCVMDEGLLSRLPKRSENSHKGNFGKVLAFVGSAGMGGAAVMASAAVLRSGAGMVTAAVPKSIWSVVASQVCEVMTLPLPTEGDALAKGAADVLIERLKTQNVLLAGCGIGTGESVKKTLLALLNACEKPIVLDADGINLLKGNINIVKNKTVPMVLTPHPLEFSRISGHSMEYIAANRLKAATAFAQSYQLVLVLKGADTIVAHPDGSAAICPLANSGLATAGSGDVLAGIIASLLAQGLSAADAADLGVWLHAQAGMAARKRLGARAMLAGDVLNALPEVLSAAEQRG